MFLKPLAVLLQHRLLQIAFKKVSPQVFQYTSSFFPSGFLQALLLDFYWTFTRFLLDFIGFLLDFSWIF